MHVPPRVKLQLRHHVLSYNKPLKLHAAPPGWAQYACATQSEDAAQESVARMLQAAHRNLLKLHAAPAGWAQDACGTHDENTAQDSVAQMLQKLPVETYSNCRLPQLVGLKMHLPRTMQM